MLVELSVHIGGSPKSLQSEVVSERALRSYFETSLPSADVVEKLGLPDGLPLQYQVKTEIGPMSGPAVIPVVVSVHGGDFTVGALSNLEAEIGDLLLEKLDRMPKEVRRDLGLAPETNVSFEIHATEHSLPVTSSTELARLAGIKPGKELGWSKGCNSWPW